MARYFTDQTLEEIRRRIDIVELIGARVTLKRSGAAFKARCPFHNEKTPSFVVNPARRSYHCFGCNAHGDIFKFLMQADGLTFTDAVRTLAARAAVKLDVRIDHEAAAREVLYRLHAELAAFYARCLKTSAEARPARDYLARRRLDGETIERFGIGYAPAEPRDALLRWAAKSGFSPEHLIAGGLLAPPREEGRDDDYYDRFRGRLMFPIRDATGRVIAFSGRVLDPAAHPAKYLNSPDTPIFQKGRVLYALDLARAAIVRGARREALVCEGQIDVIRCHACGFDSAVAAQGTAFTAEHVELLRRYADSVVLLYDGDEAGRRAAVRTGALFLQAGLPARVAALAPGEDPDSLLRDRGGETFQALIDDAVSLTAFQIGFLRRQERDPEALDAVGRISAAVLEVLADCSKAVLRSRLLQEAAALLKVPAAALEEDLEKLLRRRAARRSGRPPPDTAPDTAPAEEERKAPVATPPPAARRRAALPVPPADYGLCELLMHHGDDEEVLAVVRDWLPLELLAAAPAREIVAAAIEGRATGEDRLGALGREGAQATRELIGLLACRDSRLEHARDVEPREAAEDFVARIWIRRLRAERERLAGEQGAPERRRLELTAIIKRLERPAPWPRRAAPLAAELARHAAAPRDAQDAGMPAMNAGAPAPAPPGGAPP
jgi:DNA primase